METKGVTGITGNSGRKRVGKAGASGDQSLLNRRVITGSFMGSPSPGDQYIPSEGEDSAIGRALHSPLSEVLYTTQPKPADQQHAGSSSVGFEPPLPKPTTPEDVSGLWGKRQGDAQAVALPGGSGGQGGQDDPTMISPAMMKDIDSYSDKIKNVLAWNIMTQMFVKGSQTSLDTFLLAQKWTYEQQITVMQFMQTVAQMGLGYIAKMSDNWDQFWSQEKERREQVNAAELKAIAGV